MCVLKYVLNIYHAVGLVQVNGVVNMCVNTCKWYRHLGHRYLLSHPVTTS